MFTESQSAYLLVATDFNIKDCVPLLNAQIRNYAQLLRKYTLFKYLVNKQNRT